ncbi:MAG: hypothetical protein U9Q90_03320 [Campylobacterota bacterium]|nr:hypothetical protein [Campylobacterota bacterium]
MKLRRSLLGVLVNFLLGAAWAFVLIGVLYTFFSFYRFGFIDAVMMTFLGALPGLFFVVVLEYLLVGLERLGEIKKQTRLLEELVSQKHTTADSLHKSSPE